jgi:hypothetical protein
MFSAATSEFVVAANVAWQYIVLFAAVVGSLPLLMKIRRTLATFVPSGTARMRSTRPPFDESAVKISATVPVPSFAVFAVVSVCQLMTPLLLKICDVFAAAMG